MIVGTGFPEALQRKVTASVSFAVLLLGTVVKFTGTIIKKLNQILQIVLSLTGLGIHGCLHVAQGNKKFPQGNQVQDPRSGN